MSGGQDGATCLAHALKDKKYSEVKIVTFNYGQRNKVEIYFAKQLVDYVSGISRKDHYIINLKYFKKIFGKSSALITKKIPVVNTPYKNHEDVETWFVPGRNLIFLTVAAQIAYEHSIKDIYLGSNKLDTSYDAQLGCIQIMEQAINSALGYKIKVITPLLDWDRADEIKYMEKLGCLQWFAFTYSCMEGRMKPCGICKHCEERNNGFKKAGIEDPREVLQRERCRWTM